MEARELRIGNLVYDLSNELIIVHGIDDIDVFNKNMGDIPLHSINPIPITEEWFDRFGYSICGFKHNHLVVRGHRIWRCEGMWLCDKNGVIIKHVHQLQNLFFALTGKELELKQTDK